MKRFFFILATCLSITIPAFLVHANSSWEIQEVSLEQLQTKIAAKEELYVLIGRPDHVDTQLAIERLKEAPKLVYYLNTKTTDTTLYKKFARKYKIKTSAYLGYFNNRKQIQSLPNAGRADSQLLENFFQLP